MKHARPDYNPRIQDSAGKIPENEPVFLIRGQDASGPAAVRAWAAEHDRRKGDPALSKLARDHALLMERWQQKHGGKVADLPKES